MSYTVLLYGATGFSGRLIAAEGKRVGMGRRGDAVGRMILAARDGDALEKLAEDSGMECRPFALDDRRDVRRGLRDVHVLINAAGPFAWTGERLLKNALDSECHYVDINGEVDVYRRLDDFARYATQRKRAVVCSAGHTAAASDLLLTAALDHLPDRGRAGRPQLGAVRIVLSRVTNLSRGSAETVWRSLREEVTVVRGLDTRDKRAVRPTKLWHEPVGKLERTFDFGAPDGERDLRVATAANFVDTLTARLTIARREISVKSIESYVEAGTVARLAYQLGTMLVPVAAIPWVRRLAEQQIRFLPAGPTDDELERDRQIVLLEIEDPVRTRIVDWRWETPNAYQFTAQIALAVATRTAETAPVGWMTPGAVLEVRKDELTARTGPLRDCRLDDRRAPGGAIA